MRCGIGREAEETGPDPIQGLVQRLANSLMHRERRCAAPARRASEGVPGEYGERAQRSWSGCSGARMPGYLRDAALTACPGLYPNPLRAGLVQRLAALADRQAVR